MILNQVNHKMAIYKDCTLGEILFVGIFVFLLLGLSLSLITKIVFGYAWIGFALVLLSLVHITRFLLGKLQKVKYGKPYGYYKQLMIKKISRLAIYNIFLRPSYVERQGKWSVRRRM